MAEVTGIAWTNATWNPVRGCERVSEGCKNCYAEVLAARHSYEGGWGHEVAHYVRRPDGSMEARWTGVIETKDLLKWTVPTGVRLDWVVVGGESGSGWRDMNINDARQIIECCRIAKVPVFVKQDNGPRPGMKGRFTTKEWALKDYPQ